MDVIAGDSAYHASLMTWTAFPEPIVFSSEPHTYAMTHTYHTLTHTHIK